MPRTQCPYLGLSHDPDTFVGYPDLRNCCHRADPVESVAEDYQHTHCFSAAHRQCQVLLSSVVIELPPELCTQPKPTRRRSYAVFSLLLVLMLTAVMFLFFGGWNWAGANGWFSEPAETLAQETVETPDVPMVFPGSPTASLTPTDRPVRPTQTASPEPSATPLPPSETPVPSDTPVPVPPSATATAQTCGAPAGWVPYIVQPGDSLFSISLLYGVSITELMNANCLTTLSVYSGQHLYVPYVATATNQPSVTPLPTRTPTATLSPTHTPTPLALIRTGIAPPTATTAP